ncbi:MAG: TIGR03862 family flavoprotein [Sideroxydans sp.]|nr:TIGR03862 family flavoprotein [Sideroxydans sp.]
MKQPQKCVAVIGGGPAGLMAAEVLARGGAHVEVFDAMPSVGRKFLMAGKGGMNITHAEDFDIFLTRYGARREHIEPLLRAFPPDALRAWIHDLGITTFVGTSHRVFPADMKAAPLLRAWLHRLRESGVIFHARHRWCGWDEQGALRFATPHGELRMNPENPLAETSPPPCRGRVREGVETLPLSISTPIRACVVGASAPYNHGLPLAGATFPLQGGRSGFGSNGFFEMKADAVVLALGGGSWPQLGSDGAWVTLLEQRGITIAPLRPSNCGFEIAWSAHFREHFSGEPLKSVAATFGDVRKQGECLISAHGIEGGLIYALSAALRDEIERKGHATLHLDLLPDWTMQKVQNEVSHPRGARSLSSHLQSRLGLKGVKANLLREVLSAEQMHDTNLLAHTIKALPLRLIAPRPLSEAISSAGGVTFAALDKNLMLKELPGVFCAGEMLDWEAPTGGYLLSACFASGYVAGKGATDWLKHPSGDGRQ